jgi:hypothetical protein
MLNLNEEIKLSFVVNLEENNYFGIPENVAKEYIKTLQTHIGCVIEASKKLEVPKCQLIIHDDSKWSEIEFCGYALHFKGGGAPDRFAKAWLHHIHNNPHHWQYWLFSDGYSPEDSHVENGAIEMPSYYALEMIADWMGASMAYTGTEDMSDWLIKNIPKIRVHSKTSEYLKIVLDHLGYSDIVNVYDFAK